MQINCEDQYLEKAKELDQFFIDAFYKYKWSLNKISQKKLLKVINMESRVYGKEYPKSLIKSMKVG